MEEIKNSMILEFEVNNQIITRVDDNKVVANSIDYLYAHFTFNTNDYENVDKYGVFKYDNDIFVLPLDEENKCIIPNDVIRPTRFDVGVRGMIGNITKLIPTNYATIGVYYGTNEMGFIPLIRKVTSNTLNVSKDEDILNIELSNIYATSLRVDNKGLLQLIGKQKDESEIILSEIDLPTENIIKSITYDDINNTLVFEFENAPSVKVPMGDVFNLENYFTKNQVKDIIKSMVKVEENTLYINTSGGNL